MTFRKKSSAPAVRPTVLVVGLGNPGAAYRGTRHNVGFEVVEACAKLAKTELGTMRHRAQVGFATVGSTSVAFVKPLTFMNLSGESVQQIARHYHVPPASVLVVADDLDLPVGKVRMRGEGSSGGHNGHKSVAHSLGTTAYPRIKIGIGKGDDQTIDHVLSRFAPDERTKVDSAVAVAVKAVFAWLTEGQDEAIRIANAPSE